VILAGLNAGRRENALERKRAMNNFKLKYPK
jgi:hypothetical protein